jgi:hypothetical protein
MSILNLNAPQGHGPIGKKKTKLWMGVGLLAAVLGFGSTLAASITLNEPGGTTEFGQGVTQTVYCGGNQSVTITPLSTFQNTVKGAGTPAVSQGTFTARMVTSSSSSYNKVDGVTVSESTIYASSSATSIPRFLSGSLKVGWWLSSPTSSAPINPQPAGATIAANPNNYYFVVKTGSGEYYKASSSGNYADSTVVFRNAVSAVEGAVTPSSFKVGGVVISKIPVACDGVNFVVSSFGETGTAQTLISGGGVSVKEVAALWTGSGAVTASRDRTASVSSALVSAEQTTTTLKFIFKTESGTALTTSELYKLVVETQEDVLSD